MLQLGEPPAVIIDPSGKTGPSGQQRLVCHLHRRLPRRRITIGHEQSSVDERHRGRSSGGRELTDPGAAPGVWRTVTRHHEAAEQLPGAGPTGRLERREDPLCPAAESTGDATDGLERLGADAPVDAAFEEFGERELEQRKRTGLGERVGDELGHDALVVRDPCPVGRRHDRLVELGHRHRRDRERALPDPRPDVVVLQWSVEQVGTDGDDDPDVERLIGDHLREGREEFIASLGRAAGPALLELVDHDDHDGRPDW